VETVSKKLKRKDCGKKEEFGDFSFIGPHKMETLLKERQKKNILMYP
jgi:hypothetical protein